MKYLLLFSFILFSSALAFCQDNKEKQKNPYDVNFKAVTQQEPSYPAGDKAVHLFL